MNQYINPDVLAQVSDSEYYSKVTCSVSGLHANDKLHVEKLIKKNKFFDNIEITFQCNHIRLYSIVGVCSYDTEHASNLIYDFENEIRSVIDTFNDLKQHNELI